jgi:hypothetical protein
MSTMSRLRSARYAVLTGRPPRSIADFLTDHADAFAPIGQPA